MPFDYTRAVGWVSGFPTPNVLGYAELVRIPNSQALKTSSATQQSSGYTPLTQPTWFFKGTLFFSVMLTILFFTSSAFANKAPTRAASDWASFAGEEHLEIETGFPYLTCFQQTAKEYKLPLSLLLAVARGESDFQASAKSKKNCYGIMQIQWPGTARDLGFKKKSELFSPCANIRAGGRYLRKLLDRYQGNIHLALAAYNYGPGRIKPGNEKIPDGAAWYSGYIYDHLQYVLDRKVAETKQDYTGSKKKKIIVFNDPDRARNFLEFARSTVPEVNLDWFRMGLGRYQIVLCYADSEELQRGRRLLNQHLGFTI